MKDKIINFFAYLVTGLYVLTFGLLGLILYYVSKLLKILSHLCFWEIITIKAEYKTFWKRYRNIGDL